MASALPNPLTLKLPDGHIFEDLKLRRCADDAIDLDMDLVRKVCQLNGLDFDKVLADEESYILLTDPSDVAGLPDSFVASLKAAAEAKGKQGWAVANTRSAMPVIAAIAVS